MSKYLEIIPLSRCSEYSAILAEWAYNLWYKNSNIDYKLIKKDYKRRANFNSLPVSWLALKNSIPAGMVSLKEFDLINEKKISPWLSALFVKHEFRNQGIGTDLINIVLKEGIKRKYKKIYLFADHVDKDFLNGFYSRRGWMFRKFSTDSAGNRVSVYFCDLIV